MHSDLYLLPAWLLVAALMLSTACSPTQIDLIPSPNATMKSTYCLPHTYIEFVVMLYMYLVCRRSEMGKINIQCKCCRPMPVRSGLLADQFTCSELASLSNEVGAGGKLSYLAQHDSGVKVDNIPNAGFWLSIGTYTSAVRKSSPSQVMLGWTSGFIGRMMYLNVSSAALQSFNCHN